MPHAVSFAVTANETMSTDFFNRFEKVREWFKGKFPQTITEMAIDGKNNRLINFDIFFFMDLKEVVELQYDVDLEMFIHNRTYMPLTDATADYLKTIFDAEITKYVNRTEHMFSPM